jgi:uncharacterized protein YvpB
MAQLKILVDTVLKQRPLQSSQLSDSEKQPVKAGTLFNLQSFAPSADHIKLALADKTFQGKNTWYVYQKAAVILDNNETTFPSAVKLSVPYYDQLDNSENPYGTCNVTCMAMVLEYLGARRQYPQIRFPDELSQYCDKQGLDRHEPLDLVKVVKAYGCKDNFSKTASFQRVKEWLIQGNPAVVHGYFTPTGHIICLIGYNSKGFVVNDPYGEIMYSPYHSYYDIYASGAGLTYSYNLIYNTCCSDGEFWVHFMSKP